MRTVNSAIAFSENLRIKRIGGWDGLCEKLVRTTFAENDKIYSSASLHWKAIPSKYKHTGKPLRGGLPFWLDRDGTGFGHIALCVNDVGGINSNDIKQRGYVDRVHYTEIERAWSGLRYVGWADPWWNEDNKIIIPHPVASYTYRQGKRVYESKMHKGQTGSDSVWNLSLALHMRNYFKPAPTTSYTSELVSACRAFQLRNGWTGSGADGIAGPKTISKLGLVWVND